jgi:glycosyltransferase involved in cell wall biosynthesis
MFVLGMAPTKIGGVEKFLRALVAALDTRGWNSVLCFDGDVSPEFQTFFGLPFVTLEIVANQGNLGFAAAGSLWRVLQKHRPQVFVYAFHSAMRCFPWLARLSGAKRIFFNDHSSRPLGMVAKPLSLPKRVVGQFLTAPLTAIVSVANFTRLTGTAFGITSAKNIVVTNGIEMQPPDPAKRAALRARFGIAEDATVITQVCWMVQVKGVETMLRAAESLLKIYPSLRFLLVGGGDKLDEYKRLATSMNLDHAVLFPGIISDPIGAGVLDASDIYGQPSMWQEACPLAVLEAMSKKLPIVASDTGGLPELIADGETGILIPTGDSDRLAEALNKLIADPTLRKRMGEAGYQRVLNRHRIETMVDNYIDIFLG